MTLDKKAKLKKLQMKLKKLKAQDIMTKDVITAKEDDRLSDIALKLKNGCVSGLPVVDNSGSLVGMITITDLQLFIDLFESGDLPENGNTSFNPSVKFAMSRIVMRVKATTPVHDLIDLIKYKNIGTFPVFSGKKLVGVVGRRDLCQVFYEAAQHI